MWAIWAALAVTALIVLVYLSYAVVSLVAYMLSLTADRHSSSRHRAPQTRAAYLTDFDQRFPHSRSIPGIGYQDCRPLTESSTDLCRCVAEGRDTGPMCTDPLREAEPGSHVSEVIVSDRQPTLFRPWLTPKVTSRREWKL